MPALIYPTKIKYIRGYICTGTEKKRRRKRKKVMSGGETDHFPSVFRHSSQYHVPSGSLVNPTHFQWNHS